MAKGSGSFISGKIGDKVYSSLHGRQMIRSYKKTKKQPGTPAQKAHWAAISQLAKLSSDLSVIYKDGLHRYALRNKRDPQDVFRKLNYDFIKPEGILYNRLIVSRGVSVPIAITSVLHEGNLLTVLFNGQCNANDVDSNDWLKLFAYCPEHRLVVAAEPVLRSSGSVSMTLPPDWQGLPTHIYAYTISARHIPSDTIYLRLN